MKSYNPGNFKRQCFNSVQTVFKLLPESDPRPYISITCDAKGNPSPQNTSWAPKTLEKKISKRVDLSGSFEPLRAVEDCTKRGTTGHGYCTHAGGMGGGHPDEAGREIHGQPPPDAPGSGRRSGGGGHRESQEVFQFSGHFPAISGHPIALFHHFWTL